jgi:hypothetical protein
MRIRITLIAVAGALLIYVGSYIAWRAWGSNETYGKDRWTQGVWVERDTAIRRSMYWFFRPAIWVEEKYYEIERGPVKLYR